MPCSLVGIRAVVLQVWMLGYGVASLRLTSLVLQTLRKKRGASLPDAGVTRLCADLSMVAHGVRAAFLFDHGNAEW